MWQIHPWNKCLRLCVVYCHYLICVSHGWFDKWRISLFWWRIMSISDPGPQNQSWVWSCSMKIFCKRPTVNISKLHCWLVIFITKDFLWTTFKVIFLIFFSLRFLIVLVYLDQILSYPNNPYINGKHIHSDFRWCINLSFKTIVPNNVSK